MEWHAALGFMAVGVALFVMIVRLREAPGAAVLPGWTAWTAGLTVAALSFALWISLTTSDARIHSSTAMDAQQAALAHTNQFLQTRLRTLRRVSLLVDGRPMERNPEACRMAHALLEDLPGLESVGWIDAEGQPEWADGALTPRVLQAELEERPELRSALRVAQRERLSSVSDPVTLMGNRDELYVFVPVVASGRLMGVLAFGHGVQPLFDAIFGEGAGRAFEVELATAKGAPFYRSGGAQLQRHSPADAAGLTTGRIACGDQVWLLTGRPEAAFVGANRNASGTLVLWFGLFLAVALVFVVRKSELLRERAASLSQAKATIEDHARSLREANVSLQAQAADLQQAQGRLTSAARDKRSVLDSLSAFLIGVDHAGRVIEWNSVASSQFGIPPEQALSRPFEGLPLPWDRRLVADAVAECLASGERVKRESLTVTRGGGDPRTVSITISPTQAEGGRGFALIGADISERLLLETQLHQAQRLESVGTLAAGIAHEINTPMQFVGDNLRFVSRCVPSLSSLLALVPELVEAAGAGKIRASLAKRLRESASGVDVSFLAEELPHALNEMEEGVRRVTTIVRAMKDFSHPGQQSRQSADLNQALTTTIAVARNEYKYYADIETEFGALPPVECYVADLNQVFLNLLVNAAHAIREKVEHGGPRGTIRIATRADDGLVEIRVADSGTGIPESIRDKIFDQFFTTKPIGRGTGLGLAIVRAVVVDKHRGSNRFETEPGVGTTFVVRIPVAARPESVPA
jgi:PAS domain S-box-containing protein